MGERAGAAVDHARDVRSLSAAQAREWIDYTTEALRETAQVRQSDPDLVSVVRRLAIEDAGEVVRVAFPRDGRSQSEALTVLGKVIAPLGRDAPASGMSESGVADALRASLPATARAAVRSTPQHGAGGATERPAQRSTRGRDDTGWSGRD